MYVYIRPWYHCRLSNLPCPGDTKKGMDWRQRVKKSNLVRSQVIFFFEVMSIWILLVTSSKWISFEEQNPQEIYSLTPSSSWFFCLVDSRTGWSAGKAHPSDVWLVIVRTKRHLLDFEWSVFNGGCHRGAITNSYQVCDTSSGPEHSSKWRAVMWHWLVVELNAKM